MGHVFRLPHPLALQVVLYAIVSSLVVKGVCHQSEQLLVDLWHLDLESKILLQDKPAKV